MGIGHMTWAYLNNEEDYLNHRTKKIFFDGLKDFYKAVQPVVSIMLKNVSFCDGAMDDVAILMPENQASVDCATTFCLAKCFPAAVPQEAFDALEELLYYKLTPSSTMPSVCKETGKPTNSAELCT